MDYFSFLDEMDVNWNAFTLCKEEFNLVLNKFGAYSLWELDKKGLTFGEWVKGKLPQIDKNYKYIGITLEKFLMVKSNMEWVESIVRRVCRKSIQDQEDLVQDVLYKLHKTNHIEKYNPLKASFQRHLFWAFKTTNISRYNRRIRDALTKSISFSGDIEDSPLEFSDFNCSVNGKEMKDISDNDPVYASSFIEELKLFKEYMDEEVGVKTKDKLGVIREIKLSQIFDWFWVDYAALNTLCIRAGVESSTMRRYFEKIRLSFMQYFGIDIPMRLWERQEEYERYGTRAYSNKNTLDFILRNKEGLVNFNIDQYGKLAVRIFRRSVINSFNKQKV